MKKGVYAIFDEKAGTFGPPMLFTRDEEATRSFDSIVKSENSMLNKYPSDYKMYKLGSMDDCSGMIECVPQPEFMHNAVDFVVADEPVKVD